MAKYLFRKGKVKSHKHSRPDDSMETNDFLTYNVDISGPVFFELRIIIRAISKGSDVVGKGVYPNIYNMFIIKSNGNTPVECCTAYAEVLKTGLKEVVYHFILSCLGLDKFRMLLNVFDKSVLIFRKSEEIAFFFKSFYLTSTVRAFSVNKLYICVE